MAHTPGPWRVGDSFGPGWESAHEVIAMVEGRKKVLLSGNINFPEQARADALIASKAPEMLAILKDAVDGIAGWTERADALIERLGK